MRTFIAIDILEKARKEIVKIQKELPEFSGKKTEIENLHLTLKFLGEIDEEKLKKVRQELKNVKFRKFETEIDGIGVFSEKFIRIIWIHLKNCEKLQEEIDEKLKDLFPKEERFMSHLTIARVKKVSDKKNFLSELKKIKFDSVKFSISEFKLKKSTLTAKMPVYEDLEVYKSE